MRDKICRLLKSHKSLEASEKITDKEQDHYSVVSQEVDSFLKNLGGSN